MSYKPLGQTEDTMDNKYNISITATVRTTDGVIQREFTSANNNYSDVSEEGLVALEGVWLKFQEGLTQLGIARLAQKRGDSQGGKSPGR